MKDMTTFKASRLELFLVCASVLIASLARAQGPPVQPSNPNQPVVSPSQPQEPQLPQPQPQPTGQTLESRRVKPVRQWPQNPQMEQARSMLGDGDFQNALPILMDLAKAGHPEAQFFLGLMYERGNGVQADPKESVRWYTISALAGWSDSMFNLGQKYYKGQGVPEDETKAADLFFLVATTGDPDGQWAFGVLVSEGQGRQQDAIEGCAWLMLAANQGHEEGRGELQRRGQQLTQDQMGDAQAAAQALDELIRNDGFALEKMPPVPVPAFLAGPNEENEGLAEEPIARADMKCTISATGDLLGRATFTFDPQVYATIKSVVTDPKYFLRELSSNRADTELAPDAKASYNDATNSVTLDVHLLGFAHNRGRGRWQWAPEDLQYVSTGADDAGRTVMTFLYKSSPSDDVKFEGNAVCTFPAGATEVSYDRRRNRVTYTLAPKKTMGKGRLDIRFDARDQIMSCLYKVYGLETEFAAQWIAKTCIENVGDGAITDLRLRYRVAGYSEWSMWQKFPEVLPGQTVVSVYKPVLHKSIAELTSTTPANVLVEWRYIDSDGDREEDSDGERISILGRHEFVFSNFTEEESMGSWYDAFSNSFMISAWVTRDDPVVKQFAAMANKAAGGKGAPYSDEAAYAVLKSCYELWLANDFTYQGPVGLKDPTLSFDNTIVQNIKFPRDVIRDKSGTCIELAALYCSMAHSVGLKPYMVLIPGHAFSLIRLPSGNLLPIENTGIGGGKRAGSAPFDKVVAAATETYKKAATEGRVLEIDIEDCWARGVSSPELEMLPADILDRWKIVLNTMSPTPTPGPVPSPTPPTPTPRPSPSAFPSPVGFWTGTATNQYPAMSYPMQVQFTAGQGGQFSAAWYGEANVTDMYGRQMVYKISETFVGQVEGNKLVMQGRNKTVDANGMVQQVPPDSMTVQYQGSELVGHVSLADGGSVTWRAQKAR